MKRKDLLKALDKELYDKLFGFCYARTSNSYEAQKFCSDIVFALVKAANTAGEIKDPYAFIWRVARNVYADFSEKRRQSTEHAFTEDPEGIMADLVDTEEENEDDEALQRIFRSIAFLGRAYREVMIAYYLDDRPIAEIARMQNTSETAIRQRLFSARQTIRNEVTNMNTIQKPQVLDPIDLVIWGTGDPSWDDPSEVCTRQLSKHIVWSCKKKPKTAKELSEELSVPMLYVEEELEILCYGKKGKYGLLRRLENGRYAINFILLDAAQIERAWAIYTEHIPMVCDKVSAFIEKHKEEYLAFPYLNRKIDWNLILWQQIVFLADQFSKHVYSVLSSKYFPNEKEVTRPYSNYGYLYNGRFWGHGWDGIAAYNVCGYHQVRLTNIYIARIKAHFHYGHNVSEDGLLQLAIRAIHGLPIDSLSEKEKEGSAKAIESGYLYREGNTLYTKFLVHDEKDNDKLFSVTRKFREEFDRDVEPLVKQIAELIRSSVPDYLMAEYGFVNDLAGLPVLDTLVEALIERGILIPPENGIGAEGVWMCVSKE